MKRVSLFLIFTLIFSSAAFAATFSDVNENHPYGEAINFLADEGIVSGNPDGSFKPANKLNRAEMMKIVAEGAATYYGWSVSVFDSYANQSCFIDISANQWYTKYICYAKAQGWVQGYSDNSFRPSQAVTYPEGIKMTYEGFSLPYNEDSTPWYQDLVAQAQSSQYLDSAVTDSYQLQRQQMADLITRIIKDERGELDEYLEDANSVPEPEPEPENPTNLSCPEFQTGENTIQSGGLSRRFLAEIPQNPQGAGVVFAWHWLGGQPDHAIDWTGVRSLAYDEGYIIISPYPSGTAQYEWHTGASPNGNPDLQFFDDTLACLKQEYNIDADRVYATGHSAGALWVSYLLMHRGQDLAAVTALSGGQQSSSSYVTPQGNTPVILLWGGSTDTYGSFSFETASQQFATNLKNDGHFVITCNGDFGHQLPPEGSAQFISPFFRDHIRGQATTYSQNNLPGLPGWCSVY